MSEEAPCADAIYQLFNSSSLASSLNATAIAETLCSKYASIADSAAEANTDAVTGLNTQFLVWAGALVFVMHGGKTTELSPSFPLSPGSR